MDVSTQTGPKASAVIAEVLSRSAGCKYEAKLIATFIFLFAIAAAVLSVSSLARSSDVSADCA